MASLFALSRAEQERAKILLKYRLWAHAGTLVLGLVALVLVEPAVYALPVLALITEGAAWYLKFTAMEAHGLAEEGRRRAVLIGELGADPDTLATAELRATFSDKARSTSARWEDPDYFSSSASPGFARLTDSLQESAFWSSRLYGAAARRDVLRIVAVVAVLVVVLLVLFSVDASSAAEAMARAATVFLATLITADLLGAALAYMAAGRTSGRVVRRLDRIDPSDAGHLLAVYGDYATATAMALPIPSDIYRKQHDKIDAAWRDRRVEP